MKTILAVLVLAMPIPSLAAQTSKEKIDSIHRDVESIKREAEEAGMSRRRSEMEAREQAELNSLREGYARRKEREAAHQTTYESSLARAKKEFPWMVDPESPRFRRAQEINRMLERSKSPLFSNPEKPYIVAHIVEFEWASRDPR